MPVIKAANLKPRCFNVLQQALLVILSAILSLHASFAHADTTQRYIVGFNSAELDKKVSKNLAFSGVARSAARSAYRARVINTYGLQATEDLPSVSAVVVEATDQEINALAADAASAYGEGATVRYIEEDRPLELFKTSNELYFQNGFLWGLKNPAGPDIKAADAWEISTGSQEVVVGVVDTGIDYTHPDLAPNMWRNPGEIPGNGLDDDMNGLVDDSYGYDFYNMDGNPFDDHYHGTHVAGTIGALGNNGMGVVGVNWSVKLMALKFLGASGSGWTSGAVAAIQYAVSMKQRGVNIRVLNASFGGGAYSQAFRDALVAANNAGIMFVAAAGNSALNNDQNEVYPANYQVSNVVSVAAISSNGLLAGFSDYGATKVHLGAPGVAILSTVPVLRGSYTYLSGTSMAAPHVAGVAALVFGMNGNLTPGEVRNILVETVSPLGLLVGKTVAGGCVNAAAALGRVVQEGEKYIIAGQVTAGGAALSNVVVDGGALGRRETDANGRFEFTDVPRGTDYTLTVSRIGYVFAQPSVAGTAMSNANHNFTGVFVLRTIRGRVMNGKTPLAGVLVNAVDLGPVMTNEQGLYEIPNIPHGLTFKLVVSKLGYRITPGNVTGVATTDGIYNFAAERSMHTLAGRVVQQGKPLSGVRVSGGELGTVVTNSRGEFRFKNQPYGLEYVLEFSKAGVEFSPEILAGDVRGDVSLTVTASPARYTISGIVEQNGEPVVGARVRGSGLGTVTTGEDGRFEFRNVPYNTRFELTVSKGNIRFRQEVKRGTVKNDLEIRFNASQTLRERRR